MDDDEDNIFKLPKMGAEWSIAAIMAELSALRQKQIGFRRDIQELERRIKEDMDELKRISVTRDAFTPVRMIAYGLVASLTAIVIWLVETTKAHG